MALRIEWNIGTFTKVRRDPVMKAALRAAGERVQAACGEGYEVSEYEGKSRSRVHVGTGTYAARRDNAKNSTLARARDVA